MKKIIKFYICFGLIANLYGQEKKSDANNDLFRLVISTVVPTDIESIPKSSVSTIKNRLGTLITKNGIGNEENSQFQLVANPTLISKKVTSSAPIFILNELDLNLYLIDAYNKNIYETGNLTIKGTGNSESEAYINAFRNISASNPDIQKLIGNGKLKIIEYYKKNCSIIIKKAYMLDASDNMDEALYLLSSIPEVCEECFDLAIEEVKRIHTKNINLHCKDFINKAKNIWQTNPTYNGSIEAGRYLVLVPRSEKCYEEVDATLNEIRLKLNALETRDWEFQMKKFSSEVEIEKLYIQAQRDIGTSYGNNQPQTISNFKGWLY